MASPYPRRLAPLRFARLLLASLDNRCSFGTRRTAAPIMSAALRPPPTRFARQSVLVRHGAALRRRLVCCASPASCSLRSTIGARSARRRTAAPIMSAALRPPPYSLRSTIGARSARRRTAAPIASAALRPPPARFARQSVLVRHGAALRRRIASAALRPPPARFARQSVLVRHGAALRRRLCPLRFARLLLASLDTAVTAVTTTSRGRSGPSTAAPPGRRGGARRRHQGRRR